MKNGLLEKVRLPSIMIPDGMRFGKTFLSLGENKRKQRTKPALMLETSFCFLLENGRRLLMEKDGTRAYAPISKSHIPVLLLESGCSILLEDGSAITLENKI